MDARLAPMIRKKAGIEVAAGRRRNLGNL